MNEYLEDLAKMNLFSGIEPGETADHEKIQAYLLRVSRLSRGRLPGNGREKGTPLRNSVPFRSF